MPPLLRFFHLLSSRKGYLLRPQQLNFFMAQALDYQKLPIVPIASVLENENAITYLNDYCTRTHSEENLMFLQV